MAKNNETFADVVIIGGGVVGASVAYSLSRYDVKSILLEKENDVSLGATRANSGIIHAGYDPEPGTLMARLNVEGNSLMYDLCRNLDVPYEVCGSLVISRNNEENHIIRNLYEQGKRNGVPDLRILSAAETLEREPHLTQSVCSSLFAPTAGIVMPWSLCIAMAEVYVRNGGDLRLETRVSALERSASGFRVHTNRGNIIARFIINAAGLYSDEILGMTGNKDFRIVPSRGEYYLLDKSQGKLAHSVIFSCPSPNTKGVLVARTAHGNLIVGPTSEVISDRDDTSTTKDKLREIREKAADMFPDINFSENIRNYSGIRSNSDHNDFIIRSIPSLPGYIDVAGIKSPGLAASPAIGPYVIDLLRKQGLQLNFKPSVLSEPERLNRKVVRFHSMSPLDQAALTAVDSRYSKMVCRCETVTEGEILDAIHSPLPARTIDAIKRRTGAGLGRCQSGFCSPRIAAILAEELNLKPTDLLQDREGSYLFTGPTKLAMTDACKSLSNEIHEPLETENYVTKRAQNSSSTVARCSLAIIGAGPAGLAAAAEAYSKGIKDIIIFERDSTTGGILNQCIHTGFGLRVYNESLTGPEYAERAAREIEDTEIQVLTNTMVLNISSDRQITAINEKNGLFVCRADAIILAMGCRERTRGAISIPGSRPSGIWTAGTAQRYINIEGCKIGTKAVILGSGDIGLIMARRLTLEGMKVIACVEVMPEAGGLPRNIAQCLDDFDIPLLLSHTVTEIKGRDRLSSVVIAQVDSNKRVIDGTEKEIECDILLLSVGLIPENELSKSAGIPLDPKTGGPLVKNSTTCIGDGFFACGNVLHVHDLVDDVSLEAKKAAHEAACHLSRMRDNYIDSNQLKSDDINCLHAPTKAEQIVEIIPGNALRYVVPQYISLPSEADFIDVSFRVRHSYDNAVVSLRSSDGIELLEKKVKLVKPGEMQRLHLPSAILNDTNCNLILNISEDK